MVSVRRFVRPLLAASCLVVGLGTSGCKVPQQILQAEGRLTPKDCLPEGMNSEPVAAAAFVGTGVKLGFGDKTIIQIKPLADGPLTLGDLEAAARTTRAYRYLSETNDKVEGKIIETVSVVEKFKRDEKSARCQARRVLAVEFRTECPTDAASDQPCASKLEISTYSAADPVEAREPLATFVTKRVKHARSEKPFSGAALPEGVSL
jgi:hypothetical protein